MRSGTAVLAAMLAMAPLGAKAASRAEHGVVARGGRTRGSNRRDARSRAFLWRLAVVLAFALLSGIITGPSVAQSPTSAVSSDRPQQVREFLELLDDPVVRDWLQTQRTTNQAPTSAAPSETTRIEGYFGARIEAIQQHFASLAATFPMLPADFEHAAATLAADLQERGLIEIVLLLGGLVTLGFSAEWLFWRMTTAASKRISDLNLATVGDRLRAVAARLAFNTGLVVAFALGSVGAFLPFHWPPLLREIVLGYLLAFLAVRLSLAIGRVLLAPGGRYDHDIERFRIIPMSTTAARYWYQRLGLLVAWFAFGWVTLILLGVLGFSPDARHLVAYMLGLGLLGIALEMVWRRPHAAPGEVQPTPGRRLLGGPVRNLLLSGYFLLLWGLWVAGAMPAFWLAVLAVGLPAAISVTQRSVNHMLRPPGVDADTGPPSVRAVALERGLRAALIIGAALLLAYAWQIDLVALTASDTLFTRLVRGALTATVIVLLADFAWHVMKTVIDRKLAEAQNLGEPNSEDARRRARMRTLLPILRNILFVTLLAMAAMMALSALGVEIGPLIAGAGVVGVAIGFGAQTVVKDIISGMFYLLDDAFRVGEYIQSGSYKGTVESFSLRSVKLRHQRGPIYTVPFGELGAIQNMSRDWVIEKLKVGVTYDTDLDQVKTLIKQIGKELAQDPELAPHILQPLKMQGVEQFGDFAIQISMKMMTRPGEQFVIRRRAYAMIKKAFDANGVKIAFPTVQVAGGEEASATAVAREGLERIKPTPAA
jgi:moderate conductance mechanosensitive channel